MVLTNQGPRFSTRSRSRSRTRPEKKSRSWRFLIILLVCSVFPFVSYAEPLVEFRAAAFLPTGKLFRHIYGDVGTSYQLEVSDDICTPIQGWVNFDLIHERGQVKYCGRSKVRIYNLSFGPRLLHPLTSRSAVYLGVGLGVTRIFVRNHGCESHWKSQYTLGGVLKSGIHLYFYPQLVLDLFGDYLYQHVHLHRKADIGGFKLGGGIGWQF